MTSHDIIQRLRTRYPEPEHAFFEEVSNAAGFGRSRSADAIAMNTWPSRGLTIHGFEVKVDRRDWVRELKDPAKAEAFFHRTHCWWLVVSDPAIVHPGELPEGWGLLVPRGKGLTAAVEAARREPTLDLGFVAALLKRAVELRNKPPAEQAAALQQARADGAKAAVLDVQHQTSNLRAENDRLRESIREWEEASGLPFARYSAPAREQGDAVRIVTEQRVPLLAARVSAARRRLNAAFDLLREVEPEIERAEQELARAMAPDSDDDKGVAA